ncbi:MAG: hypothetical protein KDI32_05970 [Pseudomonadales bacterium]|jgi:hypothetical protein|nr:hypothetical protein [Pseudomonadales bacterium]
MTQKISRRKLMQIASTAGVGLTAATVAQVAIAGDQRGLRRSIEAPARPSDPATSMLRQYGGELGGTKSRRS